MDDLDSKLIEQVRRIVAHERGVESAESLQLLNSIRQLLGTMNSQEELYESLHKRIESLEKSLTQLAEQLRKL